MLVDLGGSTSLTGSEGSEHIDLRGGVDELPHRSFAIEILFNVDTFNREEVMMLLKDTDTAENVNPFLVEGTRGVVVATFAHLRELVPLVVFNVVHLSTVSRLLNFFASSCDDHEGIRKSADSVTMSWEVHICSLLKLAYRSALVVELPAFVQRTVVGLELSSSDHED